MKYSEQRRHKRMNDNRTAEQIQSDTLRLLTDTTATTPDSADDFVTVSPERYRELKQHELDNATLRAELAAVRAQRIAHPPPVLAPLDMWRDAALMTDRTRRAIRDRIAAGESVASLADDYGVPEQFVTHLGQWQLFQDVLDDTP